MHKVCFGDGEKRDQTTGAAAELLARKGLNKLGISDVGHRKPAIQYAHTPVKYPKPSKRDPLFAQTALGSSAKKACRPAICRAWCSSQSLTPTTGLRV